MPVSLSFLVSAVGPQQLAASVFSGGMRKLVIVLIFGELIQANQKAFLSRVASETLIILTSLF